MNLKPEEVFLAQGTLRPDLIESASHLASGKAEVIKTHHNDTELIRKLRDEVSARANWLLPSSKICGKKNEAIIVVEDNWMERLVSSLSVGNVRCVRFSTSCFELKIKDDDALGLVRLNPPVEEKSSCYFLSLLSFNTNIIIWSRRSHGLTL